VFESGLPHPFHSQAGSCTLGASLASLTSLEVILVDSAGVSFGKGGASIDAGTAIAERVLAFRSLAR